jgi:hypothetical protein
MKTHGKIGFRKFLVIWTVSLFVIASLILVFYPELVAVFYPQIDSLSLIERIVIAFFALPILTIWGIGVTLSSFKYNLLCAVPTIAIIGSYLFSVLFGFPLSGILTVGTIMVMTYTLLMNRIRMRVES